MAIGLLAPTLLTVELTAATKGLIGGILVLLVFGLCDDRNTLGYRAKFLGQIIAAGSCMMIGGIRIGTLTLGGVDIFPAWASVLLTFIFLIGVTNAVNLADGLDGLAGGLVLLCLCAVALFAAASGNTLVVSLALIQAGAILGFLRFNTHPARIFMGDSGSQVLGFSVGVLSIMATRGDASPYSPALPLLLLGLPIIDTVSVMFTRIRSGRSPFVADSNHLHHRLLRLGFAHREAVLLVYIAQVSLVLLAYFMRFQSDLDIVFAFGLFAGLLLGMLRIAGRSGWSMKGLEHTSSARRFLITFMPAGRLSSVALVVMSASLLLYILKVVASSTSVSVDVGLLSLGMLVALVLLSSWRAEGPLRWFEKVAAYVIVVMLVYLDQTAVHESHGIVTLSWILIGLTALSGVLCFWLSPTRRFEATTLDLLVVFIALVMPNLPGSLPLPPDLPEGIAKAVVLLYVVEMLQSVDLRRLIPRATLILTLAAVAGRSLFAMAS